MISIYYYVQLFPLSLTWSAHDGLVIATKALSILHEFTEWHMHNICLRFMNEQINIGVISGIV